MTYGFHPEAFEEYQASAIFYFQEASEVTSRAFVFVIEAGIEEIIQAPERWRVVEISSNSSIRLQPFSFRRLLPPRRAGGGDLCRNALRSKAGVLEGTS